MDVSVCIVNWNTRDLLRRCLESIERRTCSLSYEVIVVDNDSNDGSVPMVRQLFPDVHLIPSSVNLGFGRGSNLAAGAARGDYILFLNPDTELATNALLGMWLCLNRNRHYGAVGCRLLNSDGSIQWTCASSLPSPVNELSSLLGLPRLFPNSRLCSSRELNYWDHQDSRPVECLSGACMMMPRELVRQLGGFDEALFMYGEDLDLCCKLRKTGRQLHYLASEVIYHHEGAASAKKGRNFAPMRQRAANYYVLKKHFGRARALGYRAAVTAGCSARFVAAFVLSPWWVLRRSGTTRGLLDFLGRNGGLFLWSIGLRRRPTR